MFLRIITIFSIILLVGSFVSILVVDITVQSKSQLVPYSSVTNNVEKKEKNPKSDSVNISDNVAVTVHYKNVKTKENSSTEKIVVYYSLDQNTLNLLKQNSDTKMTMDRISYSDRIRFNNKTNFSGYNIENHTSNGLFSESIKPIDFTTPWIIPLSDSWHLDSERNVVDDVFSKVQNLDNKWTDIIQPGDYIRVLFDKNLTNSNDITIFARGNFSNGNVQVYEKEKNYVIAQFGNITREGKYKILLTGLNDTQNTFDLKVIGKPIEFDYVVDPSFTSNPSSTVALSESVKIPQKSVSDTVALSEKVSRSVSVKDVLALSESVKIPQKSVTTTVALSEKVSTGVSVKSAVALSESASPVMSTFKPVSATDTVALSESVKIPQKSVTTTIALSEKVSTGVSVKSAVALSESVKIPQQKVTDTLTLSEKTSRSLSLKSLIALNDTASPVMGTFKMISVNDTVALNETRGHDLSLKSLIALNDTASPVMGTFKMISVNDTVALNETRGHDLSLKDLIALNDTASPVMGTFKMISVNDTVALNETRGHDLSVKDLIALNDTASPVMGTFRTISVNDTVALNESATVFPSVTNLISVNDTVALNDSATISSSTNKLISVNDTVALNDSATISSSTNKLISVNDTVALNDSATISSSTNKLISVNDTVALNDSATISSSTTKLISVNDTVALNDSATISSSTNKLISVNDTVALNDSATISSSTNKLISVNDTVALNDSATISSSTNKLISVNDTVALNDSATISSSTTKLISVNDTVSLSDNASSIFNIINPSIRISPASGFSGTSVRVSGSGFLPQSRLGITFGGNPVITTNPTTADALGSFSDAVFPVPASTPGVYTIRVTDESNNSALASYTINHPSGGDNPGIPPILSGVGFSSNSSSLPKGEFGGILVTEYTDLSKIPKQAITTGVEFQVELKLSSGSDSSIEHVALYENLNGVLREIPDSDTNIIYEQGVPIQIANPEGLLSNVDVNTSQGDNKHLVVVFSMTFAKPMKTSDIILRIWDQNKNSRDFRLSNVLEVVQAPTSPITLGTNSTVGLGILAENQTVTNMTNANNSTDLMNHIKMWAGYSPESISDSELLNYMGKSGTHIPAWLVKTANWAINGEISIQDFVRAINYLVVNGIIT